MAAEPIVRPDSLSPTERLDQTWKIHSFLTDAGLSGATIFTLAFETSPTSNSPRRIWFATSDGLREYDGYSWVRHGRDQGLPSDFVRCVCRTADGDLWVGTDQGAGIYDARTHTFRTQGAEAGLAGRNVRRIVEDRDGTLWFCSDSWPTAGKAGGLSAYHRGVWRAYRGGDGLPGEYVVNFFRARDGTAWAATLAGPARLRGDRWEPTPAPPGNESVNWGSANFVETDETGLLCTTGRDVFRWQADRWQPILPRPIPHEHGICLTGDGRLVAPGQFGNRRRAFVEWRGDQWVQVSAEFGAPANFVMDVRDAGDGSIWVVGFHCLVRWNRSGDEWREYDRLPPPRMVDGRGDIWFAELRSRLGTPTRTLRYDGRQWEQPDHAFDLLTPAHRSEGVWGWTSSQVTRSSGSVALRFSATDLGLTSLALGCEDRAGTFVMLGERTPGVPAVAFHDGALWLPARLLPEFGRSRFWDSCAPSRTGVWFGFDQGAQTDAQLLLLGPTGVQSVPVPGDMVGLFHADIHCDADSGLWLFGEGGLFHCPDPGKPIWTPITHLPGRHVVAVAERPDEIWFGCGGALGGSAGLARLRRGEWTVFPLPAVHTLSLAPDGSLLAGGDGRFYRVSPQPTATPVSVDLPTDDPVSELRGDTHGGVWLAAGPRVYSFKPDGIPPETRVTGPVDLIAQGNATVQAEVIRRYFPRGPSGDVRFRWRLDGGIWPSPIPQSTFPQDPSRLPPGRHRIEVAATDSSGDTDPSPAVLDFVVHPLPIQSRSWFFPAVTLTLLTLVALAVTAGSARHKLALHARTLECRVAERTAQLEADLEHRRRIEAALRDSELRFVEAFRASPVVGAISSYPEGCYLEVNAQFTRTLGYTRDEVLGRTAADFGIWAQPEQRAAIMVAMGQAGTVHNMECLIRPKSGPLRVFLTSVERTALSGRQALLFASVDITERKAAEVELRDSRERLRALAAHVEAVREEERTTISREVHDELGQMLSALKMDLRWVSRRLEAGDAAQDPALTPLRHRLDEAARLADDTITTVQRIALELRPGALDTLGLVEALADEARRFEERSGIRTVLDLPAETLPRNPTLDTTFFRIFQELLTNIARHAHAARVEIALRETPTVRELIVQDDGIGIDPEAVTQPRSLGLLGMSERAASVGGQLDLERRQPHGTLARIRVPLPFPVPAPSSDATPPDSTTAPHAPTADR